MLLGLECWCLRREGCDHITWVVPSAARATNSRVYRAQHDGICKIQGVSVWICFWPAPTVSPNFPRVLNTAGGAGQECPGCARAALLHCSCIRNLLTAAGHRQPQVCRSRGLEELGQAIPVIIPAGSPWSGAAAGL